MMGDRLFVHPAIRSGRVAAYLYVAATAIDEGRTRLRSSELGFAVGADGSSVRRDLSGLIGRAGTRGYGFDPGELVEALAPYAASRDCGSGAAQLINALAGRGRVTTADLTDPRLLTAAEAAIDLDADIARIAAQHRPTQAVA